MSNSVKLETLNFDREYDVDSNEYAEYIQGREIHTKYRGLQIRIVILYKSMIGFAKLLAPKSILRQNTQNINCQKNRLELQYDRNKNRKEKLNIRYFV